VRWFDQLSTRHGPTGCKQLLWEYGGDAAAAPHCDIVPLASIKRKVSIRPDHSAGGAEAGFFLLNRFRWTGLS